MHLPMCWTRLPNLPATSDVKKKIIVYNKFPYDLYDVLDNLQTSQIKKHFRSRAVYKCRKEAHFGASIFKTTLFSEKKKNKQLYKTKYEGTLNVSIDLWYVKEHCA